MTDNNQDNTALALAIGKVEGQLRELIHTSNNNSQKLDTLNDTVLKAADLPEQVRKLSSRVEVLETERHQRTYRLAYGSRHYDLCSFDGKEYVTCRKH